jgi:hypothetical protein
MNNHIQNKQETTIFIAIDLRLTSEKLNMQNMHKKTNHVVMSVTISV